MEHSNGSHRNARVTAAIAVAVTAVVAFASLGGAGTAQSGIGLTQHQYGKKKMMLCHTSRKGEKTLLVSARSWPAHKRHGDKQGTCLRWKKHFSKKHHADRNKHHRDKQQGEKNRAENGKSRAKGDGKGHGDEAKAHKDGEKRSAK